ncbi:MAG: SDR family NAD(P)-dependent oxidoreductase [Enterococcus cecorum]|nr:SDR family NAD(P)-dependent oxidoreductase [Enterococcus cecorum]CAI3479400.1 SDR family NAD(P)-dependent oxidoreductase [Enterococcus cecorum]
MEKKVLVVTGASKSIGLQIVLAGLKAGYQVVATSRNKERLTQEVQTQLPEFQSNFYAVNMPFDEEGIRQGIAEIIEKFGRIDYLVNNADMPYLVQ